MTDASKPPRFDPFQVFEVTHQRCIILYVKILRGRNITKGWAKDLVDTPDPYVILKLANSPNAWRKTSVKDNDIHPVWEETFTFWLDRDQEHTLEMSLMDANYTVDEHLASRSFPLTFPSSGTKMKKTIHFNETSEVDMEIWTEISDTADLRFSLTLCNEEKRFIETRKRKILKVMKEFFGFAAPRNYREVPVIGIIGSGGGFRAMTAYSGVISALSQLGVLDMTTYVGGLSGSAWYISQLYSHPQWPNVYPGDQRDEIRANIDHSFLWLFRSHGLAFVKEVWKKRSLGEPVSFTDLFGHLVGNTLLKNRLDSKLSDQRRTVNDGQCPLPLYTCLHVKKSVSAMIFHEWMEFTPFEVGLPKYGTFMKSDQFSCKFFMGQIIRRFPEPPLHFLQGIWGSAFCIQFKRLLQDDKTVDAGEMMRREKEEFEEELKKDMAVCDVADSESSDDDDVHEKGTHGNKTTGGLQRKRSKSTKMKQKTFWDSMLTKMMESRWFQSIELRAAQVFNFMRGLSLNNVFPFSPFTQTQQEEDESNKATFGGIFDLHPTNVKKLYVVDSGLTFNSPYPVVLRPQREVDLILSFDFSARPSDDTPPFKELLLAAKWAELNKVPFPPIDPTIVEREGLRECYVFRHPWDPNCPIVLHFCLVNINFKREIMPGVARKTQEELDFGNFSIFDDPARPYSTFKFTYTHQEFDRLSKLMEYNTLLCKETIFNNISVCIKRRRRFSIRKPCTKKELSRLSLNSRVKMEKLTEYINMVEKVVGMAEVDDKDSAEDLSSSLPIRHRTDSPASPRPSSSPIPFLEENGAKGKEEEQEGDVIKNTKLQRATVSLRAKLVKERPKKMQWPDMGELKEELEEPVSSLAVPPSDVPPSQRPPGSPKISLTRSRPVSSSMKIFTPTERNTIDRGDSLDIEEVTAVPITNNTPNNGHAHQPQPVTTPQSLKSEMTSQNSPDSLENSVQNNGHNGTEHKKKNFPALSLKMAVQEQLSARDVTDAANGHAEDGFSAISGAGATLDLKPLVDWIDSEERVTDL